MFPLDTRLQQTQTPISTSFPEGLVLFGRAQGQRQDQRRCSAYERSLLEHQYSPLLIHCEILDREHDALKAEEAHPHADILWLAAHVHEELLDRANPLFLRITEPEARVLLRSCERLAWLAICSYVGQRRTSLLY